MMQHRRTRNPAFGLDAAEIPALVAHISRESLSPNSPKVIVDNVCDAVITDIAGTGWTIGTLGGLVRDASGNYTVDRAWPAPGTSSFSIFAIGTFALAARNIRFGDTASNGPGVSMAGAGTEYVVRNASNYALSAVLNPAPTYAFTGSMLLAVDQTNNEARKFSSNGGVSLKTGASSAGTLAGDWPALSASFHTTMGEIVHAGILVHGEGIPSDAELSEAVRYMGVYRRLPPHWKGMR